MARTLVIAAFVWPLLLGSAVWARSRAAPGEAPWTRLVYLAAASICHQRPDRSFFTAGVRWPVCGRCSGLYLAAPLGAWLAYRRLRRSRVGLRASRARWVAAVAAVPTALTLAVEWPQLAAVSNLTRALAAVPLGAAIAWILVRATAQPPASNRGH